MNYWLRIRKYAIVTIVSCLGTSLCPASALDSTATDSTKAQSSTSQSGLTQQMLQLIQQARYSDALPIAKTLVDICTNQLGHDNEITATVMHNLGFLYQQLGDLNKAEPIFLEALAIREKVLGPENPDVALSLNNLARLYQDEGNYPKAEELYKRSISIKEKAYGVERPEAAIEKNNLATLYKDVGRVNEAEQLLSSVLPIFEKEYGAGSTKVATVVNNLAGVYRQKGDYGKARTMYERAVSIDKSDGQLDYARDLNNIGLLDFDEQKYDEAAKFYAQALAIREKILGPEHPDLVPLLNNIALLRLATGDVDGAIEFQTRSNNISEHYINMFLAFGSEDQKRMYLDTISDQIDSTLSMNVKYANANVRATRLGLGTLFRRKGRVLDAMSHQLLTLRRHLSDDDKKLLDELSLTRSQLAQLVLRGTDMGQQAKYLEQVHELQAKAEKLEGELSKHSAAFKVQNQPGSVNDVRMAIPPEAALVEFARYRSIDAKAKGQKDRFGPLRYAAFVLRHDDEPIVIDLGESGPIDASVTQLRSSLRELVGESYKKYARALDALIMAPVRKRLTGKVSMLILSPDGALNFVPFGALIQENQKYLIEDYDIDYLTSGRDLMRMGSHEPSKEGPVIFANPQFDGPVARPGSKARLFDPQSKVLGYAFPVFAPLPGTAQEAKSISEILPGAKVFTGKDATEEELKKQVGPRILHVATHGFIIKPEEPQPGSSPGEKRAVALVPRAGVKKKPNDPLLLSGLVLTGANKNQSGANDDGILTALEVSGLDLWGTQLVVLSACDTASGGLKQGEGVYGLRRAILMAGAETELISLWPVSDEATPQLMIEYYKHLLKGKGRVESLRLAQLQLLRSKTMRHPRFWAAFIPVGDWLKLTN